MEATRERPAPAMAYGVFNRPPRPECRLERNLAGDYLLQQWRHERWVTLARLERCDDMWFIRSKDDAVTCLGHDDEEDALGTLWGTRWDYMGHHPLCECDACRPESEAH